MNNNKKILVVDDSDFDRNIVSSVLLKKGFKVISVNSGEKCLEEVKTSKPDLILLDIMMPGVHGTEILRILRERFNSIELPIIMVTGKSDDSDVIEALILGANDFITKPVNFEVAERRMITHLKMSGLSKQMGHLKETEAINAMITTYNHEINNPLTIALGCLKVHKIKNDEESLIKLEAALWRVADIVKKIEEIASVENFEVEKYSDNTNMIKIK